jgi:hypothetical protein
MTELDVWIALRLYIIEHFDTKQNFASHLGVSNAFITSITKNGKRIPDNILKIIGIKRDVVYTNIKNRSLNNINNQ